MVGLIDLIYILNYAFTEMALLNSSILNIVFWISGDMDEAIGKRGERSINYPDFQFVIGISSEENSRSFGKRGSKE